MAALKWTIMLLAFHLMGLFYSKSITAAPIYNSEENQLSGTTDSTLVHMNDHDISDTHETNTHNGGNDHDVNGVAEKGKDRTSSKEGQEFGNETESGGSIHENVAISPNPHEDGDMARSQGTSNDEENKEDNNKASSIEDDNVSSEGHVHKESGPAGNSDEGGHVKHEEAHDQEMDTDVASEDEADTDVAHDVEEDIGAAHEDNEDTGVVHGEEVDTDAAHDVEEDTGAAHEDNEDTGAAQDGEADTGAAHDVEDHTRTGAAHEHNGDTEAAHEDNEHTGAAHDEEVDTGAAHDVEEDNGAAHEDNEDTGAVHGEEVDTGAARDVEEDNGVAHEGDVVTDAARDVEEDTGATHEDNEDIGAAHEGDVDTGAAHDDEKNTGATHEDNEGTGADQGAAEVTGKAYDIEEDGGAIHDNEVDAGSAREDNEDINQAHEGDDIGAGHNNEEHTFIENDHKEDHDADNEDFGAEDVHKENHIAEYEDKGKYTAVLHGAFKEATTKTNGTNDKGLEPHVHHEEATAGLVHGVITQHIHASPGNGIASNGDKATGCNCSNNETDISERREIDQKYGDKNKDKPDAISTDIVKIHGGDENSVSDRIDEYNLTTSVTGCENCTVVSGPQLQKEEIRRQGADGINEPGHVSQSQDSEYSQSSTGSFVVLGIIMGTIVVLLGYSVFKSRWRNAQEAKNEDFGTEMADVKKNLLPRNEFSGGIHPTIYLEADESNSKLLADTQYKGNNAKNEGTLNVEAGIADYGVQNQKDHERYDGSHPKQEIDFDRIETQSEPNAPDNTLKSHSQESSKLLSEAVITKKVETLDVQCARHPLKPQKAPDNTSKSYSQDSTNHYPEVFIANKLETSDVQCAHLPVKPQEATDKTSKSHSQECTDQFPQLFIVKKLETADIQCVHHPAKPQKDPDNTFKPHSQESTNYFPEVFVAKKLETADVQCVQCVHHPLKPQKAPDNTSKAHSQESINNFSENVITKEVETADVQISHHPMEPQKVPDNTSKAHSQESTNNFSENIIIKKVETADVQSAHDSSHQNGLNNANVVSEVIAETPPSVPSQNNYVVANSGGLVMIPGEVYTTSMPATCVSRTVVNRPPCRTFTYQ